MANEIAVKNIRTYLSDPTIKGRIEELLKDRAGTFIVSLLSTVNGNSKLSECAPASLINAALTAASLDLPVNQNLGYAFLVPYKGVAQFQMGTKGFVQLAQRSGQFKTINVSDVREGEIKGENRLTGEIEFEWINDQDTRMALKVVGYVAYMKLINGFEKSLYMTTEELKKHGLKYSQSYKQGFGLWEDNFDSMGKKTVIKLLLSRYAPLSVEMQKATLADQAIIEGENEFKYVDNEIETADMVAKEKENNRILKYIEKAKTQEELEKVRAFIIDERLVEIFEAKVKELSKK